MSEKTESKVINIDDVPFYWLGEIENNTLRRIKVVLSSKYMRIHVGIFPGRQAGSKHVHENSEEVVFVIKGKGEVYIDDKAYSIGPGSLVYTPPGVPHQYKNTGEEELVLFAVYSPPTELPSR